jgi:hypothetical protein
MNILKILECTDRIKEEIPYIEQKPYSHNIIGMQLQIIYEEMKENEEEFKTHINKYFPQLKTLGWEHIF